MICKYIFTLFVVHVHVQTQICVNSRRTAKNPVWFEHPNFYMPERWLLESTRNIPTLAFMPFGFGASLCPSRTFVLQELHAACVRVGQGRSVQGHGDSTGTTVHKPRAQKA
jgi:cytochrome P450